MLYYLIVYTPKEGEIKALKFTVGKAFYKAQDRLNAVGYKYKAFTSQACMQPA